MPEVPFSLQPLLSYREGIVDQLGSQLASLESERAYEQDILRRIQTRREAALNDYRAVQLGRLDMERLARHQAYQQVLRAQLARQRARLLELDAEVEAKRSELLEAMKQKEMLSKLRKRREHAFLHDLDRREAAFNDEVAMMRYVRNKVE